MPLILFQTVETTNNPIVSSSSDQLQDSNEEGGWDDDDDWGSLEDTTPSHKVSLSNVYASLKIRGYWKIIFLICQPKHMLWVLKEPSQ